MCPTCDESIADKGQTEGVFDGPLGSGMGLTLTCKNCGSKLEGSQYITGIDVVYWRICDRDA